MKLGFEETEARYNSGSQQAKAWTERWVSDWVYCPNCGNPKITQFRANRPVADFYCTICGDQYELKSQKKSFGTKLVNGAYSAKRERLLSSSNPNLLLLTYDLAGATVRNLCVVPKHFFVLDIIQERKPLAPTARRAGWIGSNILLSRIPEAGRIYVVREGQLVARESVLAAWQRTLFLRDQSPEARGWLVEVMRCLETIGTAEFGIDVAYMFEDHLSRLYPNNNNVRPKIRQQLQVLRDVGYLDFVGRGRYRLRRSN